MAKKKNQPAWHDRLSNISQLGGIETSVLDNGPGRGVRIAWVNTGSALRYKVVVDRALDIADAFFNQHSLAWLSHAGVTAARPDANRGLEWLYTFAGGLVTTCGLSHMGAPDCDEHGSRGLHGRISNLPATIESIVQPDPAAGKMQMGITAVARESAVFGPNLQLRRTISSTLGEPEIRIRDVVTNCGNAPTPHMMLYHINFGWPLVDAGTDIVWKGACRSRGGDMDNALFNDSHNYRKCLEPQESHRGAGESCGIIDVTPDSRGICTVGLHNARLGIAMAIRYSKRQLPYLTNWQHWGFGEYVTALEPGTNPPTGQAAARKAKELIILKAGQKRTYDVTLTVLADQSAISRFVKCASR